MAYLSVMSKPQQWGRLGPLWLSKHGGGGGEFIFLKKQPLLADDIISPSSARDIFIVV